MLIEVLSGVGVASAVALIVRVLNREARRQHERLDRLVLLVLRDQPGVHADRLWAASGERALDAPGVYWRLKALEDAGLIEGAVEKLPPHMEMFEPRRVYRLTEKGAAALAAAPGRN